MTAVTLAQLRAEIPHMKWYRIGDRWMAAAVMVSLAIHLFGWHAAGWLPRAAPPPLVVETVHFQPIAPAIDEPLPTPPPVADVARSAPRGDRSAASGPTGPAGSAPVGMLAVLDRNPDAIALLTRHSDIDGVAAAVDSLDSRPLNPRGGVRVASAGDRPTIGSAAVQAVSMEVLNPMAPTGTPVPIGDREARRITSRMDRPVTDSANVTDNRLVREALRAKLPAVRHCYERALNTRPQLAGKIAVRVTFVPSGDVGSVAVLENGLGDSEVAGCISRALGAAHTASALMGQVTVRAPYVFAAVD